MGKTDEQLISDHDKGDTEAFAFLVERHLKQVFNFAYRLSGNSHDAEDITQESFLKAWRKLKQYQRNKNFKPWLFSIVHNSAIDMLRKKKDFVFSDFETDAGENPLIDSLADPDPLADELFAKVEDRKIVDNLFARLAPIYKEVLMLHYNNDFTFEEISQALGKPLHTVKSQHRRAIMKLKEILKKED